jgi:probable rRNA maturation factor
LAINFFTEDLDFKIKGKRDIKSWIKKVIGSENKVVGNINYIFTSDKFLLEISRKYLNHNTYTDIITFNYNQGNTLNGDIYISVDRVKENAKVYSDNFENELFRVIVHGVLHLIGYDDVSNPLEEIMRQKENIYLKLLFAELL